MTELRRPRTHPTSELVAAGPNGVCSRKDFSSAWADAVVATEDGRL